MSIQLGYGVSWITGPNAPVRDARFSSKEDRDYWADRLATVYAQPQIMTYNNQSILGDPHAFERMSDWPAKIRMETGE